MVSRFRSEIIKTPTKKPSRFYEQNDELLIARIFEFIFPKIVLIQIGLVLYLMIRILLDSIKNKGSDLMSAIAFTKKKQNKKSIAKGMYGIILPEAIYRIEDTKKQSRLVQKTVEHR